MAKLINASSIHVHGLSLPKEELKRLELDMGKISDFIALEKWFSNGELICKLAGLQKQNKSTTR